MKAIEPKGWKRPSGYANGMLAPAGGRLLFVAGQIGWHRGGGRVDGDFISQFKQALRNVLDVVEAAGGEAKHVTRLTIYVTDKAEYLGVLDKVGYEYRWMMGKHFPAMSLVEVKSLLEPDARVEIEGTAVLPPE